MEFRAGELNLTPSQADMLNKMWQGYQAFTRMYAVAPLTIQRYAGVPNIGISLPDVPPTSPNILVNGTFAFQQRASQNANTTIFPTGNYTFDQWFTQHNAGNGGVGFEGFTGDGAADLTILSIGPADGTASYGRIALPGTGNAASVLLCQPIGQEFALAYLDTSLEFTISAALNSGNSTLNLAAFEWDATEAPGARNLVSSWGNGTPVFNTGNLSMIANASFPIGNSSWTTGSLSFTPSGNAINFTVAAWIENMGNTTQLFLSKAQLSYPSVPWTEPEPTTEMARCFWYYYQPGYDDFQMLYSGNTSIFGGQPFDVNSVFCFMTLPTMRNADPDLNLNGINKITGNAGGNMSIRDYTKGVFLNANGNVSAGNISIDWNRTSSGSSNAGSQFASAMYGVLSITALSGFEATSPAPAFGDICFATFNGSQTIGFDDSI